MNKCPVNQEILIILKLLLTKDLHYQCGAVKVILQLYLITSFIIPSGPPVLPFFNLFNTNFISFIVIGSSVSGLKHVFFQDFEVFHQFDF
jgi:hypothetical protein